MKKIVKDGTLIIVGFALAGCLSDASTQTDPAPASAASAGSEEDAARTACVNAVKSVTGGADVSVTDAAFSEAGTLVNLRVGPTGTWQCIGYSDGTTAGVMSITNEGRL